ncbi:MAG: hypothetical protein HOP19_04395 [Acidobacteria bacterium]|nr:hypothetical protein [Acidobacteriota bacterium]
MWHGRPLAGKLTDVPGSSNYFISGVVSYANAAKVYWLTVPRELLETDGA